MLLGVIYDVALIHNSAILSVHLSRCFLIEDALCATIFVSVTQGLAYKTAITLKRHTQTKYIDARV